MTIWINIFFRWLEGNDEYEERKKEEREEKEANKKANKEQNDDSTASDHFSSDSDSSD